MLSSQYFLVCLLSSCLQLWREKNPGDLTDHPEVPATQCNSPYGHCLTDITIIQRPDVALDDRVANRILATISPFLRQPPRTATAINREIEHRSLLLRKRTYQSESIFTETYNCMSVSEHYTAGTLMLTRLYVIASRVAFYVSINNWCVTYNRIKSRLEALAHRPSNVDEIPQIGEVQLMECTALNKERISKILERKIKHHFSSSYIWTVEKQLTSWVSLERDIYITNKRIVGLNEFTAYFFSLQSFNKLCRL